MCVRRCVHFVAGSVLPAAAIVTLSLGIGTLAARAVRQITDSFCDGSVEELVHGMVEAKVLKKAELDQLEELVQNHRKAKNCFIPCTVPWIRCILVESSEFLVDGTVRQS